MGGLSKQPMERDSRGVGFEEYGSFETKQWRCRDEWAKRMGYDDLATRERYGQDYVVAGNDYFGPNSRVQKLKMPTLKGKEQPSV